MFGGIIKSPSPNEQFEQFLRESKSNPIIILYNYPSMAVRSQKLFELFVRLLFARLLG